MSQQHPAILLALADLDPTKPTGRTDDGRPYFTVRSRVQFTIGTEALRDAVVRPGSSTAAVIDTRADKGEDCPDCKGSGKVDGETCSACGGDGMRSKVKCESCDGKGMVDEKECSDCGGKGMRAAPPIARAASASNGSGDATSGRKVKGPRIEGVASSTGRDAYGTEMSRQCLEGMSAQFRSGQVPYLPQHPSWSGSGGEWDDVMGYVYDGTVERGDVAENTNPGEFSYVLRVGVQLDEKHPKTAMLADKISDGYPVGQSIGGWFTKLTFVWPEGTEDDDKWWSVDPDRIVVEEVELDHLAATRRPANVESWIDGVRSAIRDFGEARSKARPASKVLETARAMEEAERARVAKDAGVTAPPLPAEPPEARSAPSEVAPLDTDASARNATDEPTTGSDAREALPHERADEAPLEPSMTPEEIARIASEAAVRAVEALEAKRAAAAAPVVKTPEQIEIEQLRARAEKAEQERDAVLAAPARRGVVVFTGHVDENPIHADAEFRGLIDTLDTEKRGKHMVAVLRSKGFVERRTGMGDKRCDEALNDTLATLPSTNSLRSDLRALCMAAEDDGLIRDPSTVGWGG